jgi:cytoskeletal protein RodZ
MSCDTAVEALSRASSGATGDAAAPAEQACSPEQLQGRQTGQEQVNSTSQQRQAEGDTAADGPAAAQADDSPAGDPLTLRQRFSFGLFRPLPPPPPPPQDAALQNV